MMFPRSPAPTVLLLLVATLAGCVTDEGGVDRGRPEARDEPGAPWTVVAVTGHAVLVDDDGAATWGGEPVQAEPVHAEVRNDALWECIAWPGGAETQAPYGPVSANATSVRRDPACRAEGRADVAWTTDRAVLFGDTLPGTDGRDAPFFVAAVERGDCSPAVGSAFEGDDHGVEHPEGYRARAMEFRYTCPGGDEEWLYLTKSGSVFWPPDATVPATRWVLGFDTCDDAHYPSDTARGVCTDGTTERFDDTSRSVVLHAGTGPDGSPHRGACRDLADQWYVWDERPRAEGACPDEHHFTAEVDLYFFDDDPTRSWGP